MLDFVAEVGEVGADGSTFGNRAERFLDRHMGGMRLATEGIDDQGVNSMDLLAGGLGDPLGIGNVGKRGSAWKFEKEAVGFYPAMLDGKRGNAQWAEVDRADELNGLGFDVSSVDVLGRKSPAKHLPQGVQGFAAAVHRQGRFTTPAKGSEFIKTGDVIDVAMGVEDGIDLANPLAQGLLAEIGTRINEQLGIAHAEVDR